MWANEAIRRVADDISKDQVTEKIGTFQPDFREKVENYLNNISF